MGLLEASPFLLDAGSVNALSVRTTNNTASAAIFGVKEDTGALSVAAYLVWSAPFYTGSTSTLLAWVTICCCATLLTSFVVLGVAVVVETVAKFALGCARRLCKANVLVGAAIFIGATVAVTLAGGSLAGAAVADLCVMTE